MSFAKLFSADPNALPYANPGLIVLAERWLAQTFFDAFDASGTEYELTLLGFGAFVFSLLGVMLWTCCSVLKSPVVKIPMKVALVACYAMAIRSLINMYSNTCGAVVYNSAFAADTVPEISITPDHSPWHIIQQHKVMGAPVVLRNVIPQDILAQWTPEALAQLLPADTQVHVHLGPSEQATTKYTWLPFSEFAAALHDSKWDAYGTVCCRTACVVRVMRALRTDRKPYLAESTELLHKSPAFAAAVSIALNATCPRGGSLVTRPYLWVGPKGASTGLHADRDPVNILHQMYGTKRLWLYHIKESHRMYASTKFDTGAIVSQVDPFAPNVTAFPLYEAATPIVVDIHPGDALYIPSGWFHYVTSLTPTVSLSGRSYTVCESYMLIPVAVQEILHYMGLYRVNDCTCHDNE